MGYNLKKCSFVSSKEIKNNLMQNFSKSKQLISDWKNRRQQEKKTLQKTLKQTKKRPAGQINEMANEIHDKIFEEIDCLDCAGCCSGIPPIVNRTDANRIARFLGMKSGNFYSEYLKEDEDGDTVMKTTPCPFLESDNKCSIYKARPKACREYPHTDHFSFVKNAHLHLANARYCPAVFHILEKMKDAL